MKKSYLFFLCVLSLLFTACGKKTTALSHFKNDPERAAAIQYTKKRDIIYKKEPKAMIFATYLNKIHEKYESDKLSSFIIGIHLVNKDNQNLIENEFKLLINGKNPKNMIKLKKGSEYLKKIPLKNPWAHYYLVHLDNEKRKKVSKLNIKLTHPVFGQTNLSFDK